MHMPQNGAATRRFLYVEVPAPTKRASSVRLHGGNVLKNGRQPLGIKDDSDLASGKEILSDVPGPSLKGKERQVDQEGEVGNVDVRRSGSPQQSGQAVSEEYQPVGEHVNHPNGEDVESALSSLPEASPSGSLLAPAISVSSSSSTTRTAVDSDRHEAILPRKATDNIKGIPKKRKKRVIEESDASETGAAGSLAIATVHQVAAPLQSQPPTTIASDSTALPTTDKAPSIAASSRSTNESLATLDTSPKYTKLGVDEEITKILGRKQFGSDYAYTVKLKSGHQALIAEADLESYPDLLQDWNDLANLGWREDGEVYGDSESEGEPKEKGKAMRKRVDSDDLYDGVPDAGSQREEESYDEAMSEEEEGDLSDESEEVPLSLQASRRSEREAARKKIDYSKQAEYNEEDEDMSEGALSDSESEQSVASTAVTSRVQRNKSGRGGSKGKRSSGPSTSTQPILLDDDSEEEFIEGGVKEEDLRPEQFHCRNCSNCKASSARQLLPDFIKKQKRKRKKASDDLSDWDVSSIKEYGSWLQCEVCSGSWHWKCLPGYASANGMRVRFKKMVNAKYGPGSHLNINKTFKIPSCPDCLKPKGSTCKFCLQSEKVRDITKEAEIIDPESGPSKDQVAPSSMPDGEQASKTASPGDTVPAITDTNVLADGVLPGQDLEMVIESEDKDLLFRCSQCRRAAHYSCIPTRDATDQWQYFWDWHCDDCKKWGPIDAILAWRPLDWNQAVEGKESTTQPASSPQRLITNSPGKRPEVGSEVPDHTAPWWNAEYLVKFKETSFRNATWVPHSWLFSAYKQRLRNFLVDGPLIDITPDNAVRDGEEDVVDDHLEDFSLLPTPDAFDKIPKEWLTPDRILDVRLKRKSGSGGDPRVINMKNRITNDPEDTISRISEMYVKWQGLPYDAATWEKGFPQEDEPQYGEFVRAYSDYLKFRNVEIPRPSPDELAILDRARPRSQFKEITNQPNFITLGKLMDFQLLGVSWLYFNWWVKKGCILADEMGLGKTVQIISFLSILFRTENCKPFLVVVPNSTLQNWQREFARWAPDDMRVVPYYGTRASRQIIEEFELFSEGTVAEQKLRTHVVLTTYECMTADASIFKRVPRWEALVVDEAQRLKSGPKNLLWRSLKTLHFGHTVLLTGTPVNNNLDELFNLLYFLDPPSFRNLDELHTRYETLTPELVDEVQALAQPYFLRRTKEAVLNLPTLSEVIVPLSMSPLQKLVYKSVLEKNMDALKAIYDASKAKTKKKVMTGKCVNVLMELRKTLCHPYLVRDELEHDTNLDTKTVHKNLVEASSKLTFLAEFLPKLKERGHRVLLFSQFVIVLNVVERFLEGMKIKFVRLDGNTSQAQRQKHIDAYNAPGSEIFVFILTTRAGGVGINLATADTVILFDADFNPFQDMQAISRAHRIGQTKKVMCFKLMVKGTCEEKIIETGKKKMVLEQLIVDSKDLKNNEDEEGVNNVESLLLFGAQALFNEEPETATKTDINYSARDMEDLITRTENEEASAEEVEAKKQRTLEANKAFSYARVWDRQVREQEEEADRQEVEAQRGFWSKMIEAKEKEKKDEELARALQMGRGYRRRQQANYNMYGDTFLASPATSANGKAPGSDSGGDDDFDVTMLSDESDAEEGGPGPLDPEDLEGLALHKLKKAKISNVPNGQPTTVAAPPVVPAGPSVPVYTNPLPIDVARNQPPHPRYEMIRSPTPPEVTEKRTALLKNLLKRAELLQNTEAVALIRQATEVKSGFEQVVLCQKAAALLISMAAVTRPGEGNAETPSRPMSNGTHNGAPLTSLQIAATNGYGGANDGGGANGHASTSTARV